MGLQKSCLSTGGDQHNQRGNRSEERDDLIFGERKVRIVIRDREVITDCMPLHNLKQIFFSKHKLNLRCF